MSGTTAPVDPIVRSVTVRGGAERAFRIFTERMGSWWPHGTHSRAAMEFEEDGVTVAEIEFQGRVGGRILEHLSDGRVMPWAEVLVWEPPARFVVAWKPHDRPQPPTEVEVTFVAEEDFTRVTLEHRGWERLTEDVAEVYASYGSGWVGTLSRFAEAANEEEVS